MLKISQPKLCVSICFININRDERKKEKDRKEIETTGVSDAF